jgi:2-dehydro-3-deoxyphosphogluconate aldolase/(4S)-4-hydroxy-2-oxoglutarate aldolase
LSAAVGQTLHNTGVVAVIRTTSPDDLVAVATALQRGGVTLIEITMTVPGALEVIREASRVLDGGAAIGAGTVLDATTARLAMLAGASFVVGPTFDAAVADCCRTYDCAYIPGALTPTEILAAWKAGATAVKVFPGRIATPGYFRDVLAPLPHVRLMVTGNVDLSTAPEYIAAGAVAVGVGKALVELEPGRTFDADRITENAHAFRTAVDRARSSSRPEGDA